MSGAHPHEAGGDRRQFLWLAVIAASAGVIGGLLGGVLSTRVSTPAQPGPRLGVVNLTRLTQASAATALKDPAAAATFPRRFEQALAQLSDANPGLVLLVKEAVVAGGQVEDFTDAILPIFGAGAPAALPGGATVAAPPAPTR